MAANAAEEQAFLDGTHPALQGNATAMASMRASSPTRSASPSSSTTSSPRFKAVDDDPPTSSLPALNPTTRRTGASNTGPKGVIADWKARGGGSSVAVTQTGPKGVLQDWRGSVAASAAEAVSNLRLDGEDDEADDEAAIEQYRRRRLAEMSGSGTRGPGKGRKVFGHLREIGEEQFLSAIEEEDPDVAVVLHIYEPGIEACHVLNAHLSALARDYPYTKFVRALATEVDFAADDEDDALPTVIVYRGGELESTLVRLDRDWGNGTKSDILKLLTESKAVTGSPVLSQHRKNEDSDSGDSD